MQWCFCPISVSTGISASPRVFDHFVRDCWGSRSKMKTRSPASCAATASEDAMVLLPDLGLHGNIGLAARLRPFRQGLLGIEIENEDPFAGFMRGDGERGCNGAFARSRSPREYRPRRASSTISSGIAGDRDRK